MNEALLDKVPGVRALTREEKWELVGLLWEELGYCSEERDAAIANVLTERAAEFRIAPENASRWDEVQKRFEQRNLR